MSSIAYPRYTQSDTVTCKYDTGNNAIDMVRTLLAIKSINS
jgi:hypothetical protein